MRNNLAVWLREHTGPQIMGILNITPDSFSGDGLLSEADYVAASLGQAEAMLAAGATILDVGGASSRPGSQPASPAEEIARVTPVIRALRTRTDAVISIDTYQAPVAAAALDTGANWVNDIWALGADPAMGPLIAARKAPIILMHNRAIATLVQTNEKIGATFLPPNDPDANIMESIIDELAAIRDRALSYGIDATQIILDPGLGFGKSVRQNLQLIKHANQLQRLGQPILLGPSRKSFIGLTLDLPVQARDTATSAIVAMGVLQGIRLFRVHEVAGAYQAARMAAAISAVD